MMYIFGGLILAIFLLFSWAMMERDERRRLARRIDYLQASRERCRDELRREREDRLDLQREFGQALGEAIGYRLLLARLLGRLRYTLAAAGASGIWIDDTWHALSRSEKGEWYKLGRKMMEQDVDNLKARDFVKLPSKATNNANEERKSA